MFAGAHKYQCRPCESGKVNENASRCHKGANKGRESAHSSSLGRYVFGSEISYNKAPPRLPGLGC